MIKKYCNLEPQCDFEKIQQLLNLISNNAAGPGIDGYKLLNSIHPATILKTGKNGVQTRVARHTSSLSIFDPQRFCENYETNLKCLTRLVSKDSFFAQQFICFKFFAYPPPLPPGHYCKRLLDFDEFCKEGNCRISLVKFYSIKKSSFPIIFTNFNKLRLQ